MSTTNKYNENYVREAAYYCWKNAGCPYGQDEYFWNMAIKQLYGTTCSKSSCSKSSCSTSSKKSSSSSSKKVTTTTSSKK